MGIYLPIFSFLIEPFEVPEKAPETYNDIIPLLEKYHKKSFQFTTKGYHHTELLRRMINDFRLPSINFYLEECAIIKPQDCPTLLEELKTIEHYILNDSQTLNDNLINEEQSLWELFDNNKELNKNTKTNKLSYLEKRITLLKSLSLAETYQEISIQKEVSTFDLQDAYGNGYHDLLAILYWVKTHIHLLKEAVANKKALCYVWITS